MRRAPLLLAVGGEPFEYPHPDWDDLVHFIGACEFEPMKSKSATTPSWLAAIDRPIVLLNTSSIAQADARLARIGLQALADEPVHVVATFAAGVPHGLPTVPNATVCRFVNHRVGSRPGDLCDHPRWDGNHREGAQSRCPGLRGALRP